MSFRRFTAIGVLFVLVLAGVWLLARPSGLQEESADRQQALRQSLAPVGAGLAGEGEVSDVYAPISPVVVTLAEIPINVYDPNNMYDRWLRGEIDLDETDGRVSQAELAAMRATALELPASAGVQIAPDGPGPSAPTPGLAFDSLDMTQCCGGGGGIVPPDPEMAAGPNHLIAIVNLALEIYDKNGTTVAGPTTMASFFSSLGGGCASNPFDPNTVYDEEADRWVIAADGNGTNFCIGVSQTADPTGSYNLYSIPAQPRGGEFHDYPHTGVGDNYFVVGANQFGGAVPGGFEGRVWALNKSVMYSGGALTPVTASTGSIEGTPQPLHLHGYGQGTWPAYGDTHYFVTDPYDGCTLNVWRWNIPAAPSIVSTFNLCTATGVSTGQPLSWPQQGGGNIEGNDWRMRGFEYRNGYGWVADSVSCNPGGGTVNCVRWDQIDLTTNPPTLVQAGVYASAGQYRTFPDLAVNSCDDMVIGYTKGSSSSYPSIWYTGRENFDPAGTLQAEAMLKDGETRYLAFDGVPYRWGDYTGLTIDPDGQTFWYLGQYSKSINPAPSANWGTYIGSFTYDSCSGLSQPAISLVKTVGTTAGECATTDAITVPAGTNVYYCYEVTNTGNVALALHDLEDDELGTIFTDLAYDLLPGQSVDTVAAGLEISASWGAGVYTNTALWTAYNAGPTDVVTATASAVVTVEPAQIYLPMVAAPAGNGQAPASPVSALPAAMPLLLGGLVLSGVAFRRQR